MVGESGTADTFCSQRLIRGMEDKWVTNCLRCIFIAIVALRMHLRCVIIGFVMCA